MRWHESVEAGLRAALDEARVAGVGTGGQHPPGGGAAARPDRRDERAVSGGTDVAELVDGLRAEPAWRAEDAPHLPVVTGLDTARELGERTGIGGRWDRWLRRGWRSSDNKYGGAIAPSVILEAMRQAVRLDDGPVTAAHLLLGVVRLGTQLRTAGRHLRLAVLPYNGAPDVLDGHGVTLERVVAALPAARATDRSRPRGRVRAGRAG